jgi:hypothetical protein
VLTAHNLISFMDETEIELKEGPAVDEPCLFGVAKPVRSFTDAILQRELWVELIERLSLVRESTVVQSLRRCLHFCLFGPGAMTVTRQRHIAVVPSTAEARFRVVCKIKPLTSVYIALHSTLALVQGLVFIVAPAGFLETFPYFLAVCGTLVIMGAILDGSHIARTVETARCAFLAAYIAYRIFHSPALNVAEAALCAVFSVSGLVSLALRVPVTSIKSS